MVQQRNAEREAENAALQVRPRPPAASWRAEWAALSGWRPPGRGRLVRGPAARARRHRHASYYH
jgi:hypothetical protein